jgi:FkbM family methyltransferase
MRAASARYLEAGHDFLVRAKFRALPDARLNAIQRWTRDGGERLRTLRLGLNSRSTVLDFGGYRGDYAARLRELYDCRVHVFEPVPQFAEDIEARFIGDPMVVVHGVAVGRSEGTTKMFVEADATGTFASGSPVEVPIVSAQRLAAELPRRIDLAKINIEGGEYELLPAMDEAGLLRRTDRLIIQFHDVTTTARQERRACQQLLEKTHRCDWDYPFVWESWSRQSESTRT